MTMQFSFYPGHERGCGHPNDCPHMGGAGVGMLVQLVNTAEDSRMYLHRQLDAERQRSSELVADVLRLEEELKQARLELRLERQNKFATNEQKSEDKVEPASDTGALRESKKRGAPAGHPGWFRPIPTQYDWLVEVPPPRCCPHCRGSVSTPESANTVDHLQEDIINNLYQVILYRHQAGRCNDCRRWVQQAGKDEILNSRIGPFLRSRAIWLRNVIGISYRKIPQIIEELHGIRFTPAALIGFETMLADKAAPVVDDIAKKLASSDGAVHADETYWTTDGSRSYFWVHVDHDYVHFQYDTSRAGQVSRDILGEDFCGTLVTDCYSGYNASAAGAKQKCLAHLARAARDWQKLTETDSLDYLFFEDIKQFVKRGCEFHRQRGQGKLTKKQQAAEKAWLRGEQSRLETCLVEHEKALTLQARIFNHTLEWLVFLDDPRVEPTNNMAERALRPLVVVRKITFGSRSDAGARRMASLMTVGETARRHGHRASQIYFELFTRPPDRVLRTLYAGA
jgi:transposase